MKQLIVTKSSKLLAFASQSVKPVGQLLLVPLGADKTAIHYELDLDLFYLAMAAGTIELDWHLQAQDLLKPEAYDEDPVKP